MKYLMKGIDVVYHCAATAHEGLSVFSPYEITKIIIWLLSQFFQQLLMKSKKNSILFFNGKVRRPRVPFSETMKPKPVDPYAISKVASEEVSYDLNGVEWVIAIPAI